MNKKKNRRSNTKYPALKPELNLKTRYNLILDDYSNDLPDKKIPHCDNLKKECKICNNPKTRMINPKEWANQFNEEYVNARFDKNKKPILNEKLNPMPVKTETIENAGPNHDITTVIVTKNTYKKQSYDGNNARNRCILTQQNAAGRMVDYEKIKEKDLKVKSPEEELLLKEELSKKKHKSNA